MKRRIIFSQSLILAALLLLSGAASASTSHVLTSCTACGDSQMQSAARTAVAGMAQGDDAIVWVADAQNSIMKKYQVVVDPDWQPPQHGPTGAPTGPKSPLPPRLLVTEMTPVEPQVLSLLPDLHQLWLEDPAFFDGVTPSVDFPLSDLPFDAPDGQPWSAAHLGYAYYPERPYYSDVYYNDFQQNLNDILEAGDGLEGLMNSIADILNSISGLDVLGFGVSWDAPKVVDVNFTNANGDHCSAVVSLENHRMESFGNCRTAHNVPYISRQSPTDGNMTVSFAGASGDRGRYIQALQDRGVPIGGDTSGGWLYITLTFVNGTLVHVEIVPLDE